MSGCVTSTAKRRRKMAKLDKRAKRNYARGRIQPRGKVR